MKTLLFLLILAASQAAYTQKYNYRKAIAPASFALVSGAAYGFHETSVHHPPRRRACPDDHRHGLFWHCGRANRAESNGLRFGRGQRGVHHTRNRPAWNWVFGGKTSRQRININNWHVFAIDKGKNGLWKTIKLWEH